MPIRFFADDMLGKLTRWLRLAGFDTRYERQIPDADLVRIAAAEERVILTRDRKLSQHWQVEKLFLVGSEFVTEQIGEVFGHFKLAEDFKPFTRCLECNGTLASIRKEDYAREIPPFVYKTLDEFHRCSSCGHIYWKGTHYESLARKLRLIQEALKESSNPQSEIHNPQSNA